MSALTIARIELVRLFRERSNWFFVLVFPLLLVVLIGATFGAGFDTRIGVVAPDGDEVADAVVAGIDDLDGVVAVPVGDADRLVDDVSRGDVTAGVVVPDGYGAAVDAGEQVEIGYVGRADAIGTSVRALVEAVVADQAAVVTAARVVADTTGRPAGDLVRVAGQVQPALPGVDVDVREIGEDELAREFAGLGQFDLGASSQLFLFVFLTSLTSAAALIQTRQLGVARRILSTPTSMPSLLAGQAGGRFLVAVVQAGYIIVATALLFGVNWGDPLATGLVVVLFCLVAAGAGMLIGAVFDNDSQAAGAGVGLGLVLAALGGSMAPLEIFPAGVRAVARVTPHAWANGAMAEIVRRDGSVADVLPQLGVLAAFAAALLALAAWRLHRALTR